MSHKTTHVFGYLIPCKLVISTCLIKHNWTKLNKDADLSICAGTWFAGTWLKKGKFFINQNGQEVNDLKSLIKKSLLYQNELKSLSTLRTSISWSEFLQQSGNNFVQSSNSVWLVKFEYPNIIHMVFPKSSNSLLTVGTYGRPVKLSKFLEI